MNDTFKMESIDEILFNSLLHSNQFMEICNLLDEFDRMCTSDIEFTEAVEDPKSKINKTRGKIVKSTVDTTRSAAQVWSDTTNAGGKLYKSAYDLMMSGIKLVTKVVVWMIDKAVKIPQSITKVIDGVSSIPDTVKVKIRGDIKLYITADDIRVINESVINRMSTFIADLELLMKGDFWTSFFHRHAFIRTSPRKSNSNGGTDTSIPELIFGKNDMAICRRLEDAYNKIKIITFKQSTIDMSNKNNIELYFGTSMLLPVRVYHPDTKSFTTEQESYYQSLRRLATTLNDTTNTLSKLQKDFDNKFNDSKFEEQWARMSALNRSRIEKTVTAISKTIALIGNIQRYILIDMKTISEATSKIVNSGKTKGVQVDQDASDGQKINVPKKNKID